LRFGKEAVIGKGMIREREVFMYGNGLDKSDTQFVYGQYYK